MKNLPQNLGIGASQAARGVFLSGLAVLALSMTNLVFAGSATRSASPATGDWNTAANWSPATVPNGASDVATFQIL